MATAARKKNRKPTNVTSPKIQQRAGEIHTIRIMIYGMNAAAAVFCKITELSLTGRFIKANESAPEWRFKAVTPGADKKSTG